MEGMIRTIHIEVEGPIKGGRKDVMKITERLTNGKWVTFRDKINSTRQPPKNPRGPNKRRIPAKQKKQEKRRVKYRPEIPITPDMTEQQMMEEVLARKRYR